MVIFFTLFKAGFLSKQRNENWKTAGMYTSTSATNTVKIIKEISIWLAEVMSPKLEMLGPLRNQKVHLSTDSKTLCYYSILKLKYSPSILEHNKG